MTIYVGGKQGRWIYLILTILILLFMSWASWGFLGLMRINQFFFILFLPLAFSMIYSIIYEFSSFIIDEVGITKKMLGKRTIIVWDEMKYIGVREQDVDPYKQAYLLYFSKIPMENVAFRQYRPYSLWQFRENLKQNSKHFFITYHAGMLEEILKHVSESRIRDVERIKNCPEPHKLQSRSKMRGESLELALRSTEYRIDNMGVSYDLPTGGSVTLSWNEAAHIGIAEVRPTAFDYLYCIYFSKIPLKKTYFHDHEERKLTPSNEQVFIPYREGLLDEVLQYVDKSKIHKIERILDCPNPHEMQRSEKPRVLEMD